MGASPTDVADVARTIQAAVAPVFLLAGIGSFMNVIASRLSRVVDRSRVVERFHGETVGIDHVRHVAELRMLDRRIKLASDAMFLCVASGRAVCALVALMFVGELSNADIGRSVAVLFVLALGLLAIALICFLVETRIAVGGLRVRGELLEQD